MKNLNFNRKNPRLKNYDYSSNGYYFITINTYKKNELLSYLNNSEGKLILTDIGSIVEESIFFINNNCAKIEYYAIMPDHLHLLIFLNESKKSIPEIIKSLKGYTASKVASLYNVKLWQKSYYDSIITSEDRKKKVIEYIKYNPHMLKIKEDKE